jgi:[ribosomal protein S5]-alanine N-acetyltransferase
MPALETRRLRLVPITLDIVEAVLDRDRIAAESAAGFEFPDNLPNDELVARAFPYSRDALRADPEVRLWGDSLVVLRDKPLIIGSVVFHGRPTDGIAEVAYGIEEHSRGRGFASEATRACVEWALDQAGIEAVQATTFPWHTASLGVIRRAGMHQVTTREHDTLGELLVFERRR